MRKFVLFCASFCAMLILFSASPVRAQLVVYWVSPNGSDANNCAQTSPCLTFQGAINRSNGEPNPQVRCLTSGNYGTINLTTSFTIDCGAGNVGEILDSSSSGHAVTINTNSAATVILRHLSLSNFASTGDAINATMAGGSLIVEDCSIQNFTAGNGVTFVPGGGRGQLQVSNSRVVNNGVGIAVSAPSGQIATVTINQVEMIENNGYGLFLGGLGVVAGEMRNSVAVGSQSYGVYASTSQVYFTLNTSSFIANLVAGIKTASNGSNLNVTGSTISGNGTGVLATNGSIISFGNNTLNGNGSNGAFTSTEALQ